MGYFSLNSQEIKLKEFQEVEITYTEESLLNKLKSYQLEPIGLLKHLSVDSVSLGKADAAESASANIYLQDLSAELKKWQNKQDIKTFTKRINQLIFFWLSAVEAGISTQRIINYLKCFKTRSRFGLPSSSKLHCFLFDLLAETTQQHQQFQLNYSLNFDQHTHLPNASQVSTGLAEAANNATEHQLLAMLSIHFQVAKNNPVLSQSTSVSLSKSITAILQ